MVICRFFLEGRCKYGDKCFNEHLRGGTGGGGRGVTLRDSFGTANQQNQNPYRWTAAASPAQAQHQQNPPQQASNISVQDIVKNLPKEMEQWQTSKMWPFSCFSLEKEIPSLPDFVDMSPEELRQDAYTAMKDGTLETHKQKVLQLVQEYRQKQDQIRAMPPALRQKLEELLDEGRRQRAAKGGSQTLVRPSTFSAGGSGAFGAGNTLFGKDATGSSSSVFGGSSAAASGSVFGASTSQTSSIFGQPPATATAASSVFGSGGQASSGGATASVFGGKTSQPAPGLFGSGAMSTAAAAGPAPSAGLFGQSAGGLFGNAASTTNPPPAGLFGQAASATATSSASSGMGFRQPGSVFGGQNANAGGGMGIFGQTPASSGGGSFFGQQATAAPSPGLFSASGSSGGTTAQPGLLMFTPGATGSPAPAQPGAGLFGKGPAGATNSAQAPNDSTLYSQLADLTQEERTQFEAQTFTLGLIPMRPPPRELINT